MRKIWKRFLIRNIRKKKIVCKNFYAEFNEYYKVNVIIDLRPIKNGTFLLGHIRFQTLQLYLRIVRPFDGNKITINTKKRITSKYKILRMLQIFIRLIQFYLRK